MGLRLRNGACARMTAAAAPQANDIVASNCSTLISKIAEQTQPSATCVLLSFLALMESRGLMSWSLSFAVACAPRRRLVRAAAP